MKDYRIKVTVRNNLLLSAIENAGFGTQAEFADYAGMKSSEVNALVAMRKSPISFDGGFIESAKKIMEALGAAPSDLWTDEQLYLSLNRNSAESCVDHLGIQFLLGQQQEAMTIDSPEETLFQSQSYTLLNKILGTLKPREKDVLRMRYFDDLTQSQCADRIGVTKERVRQIESKALRKMRHPDRVCHLQLAEVFGTKDSIPSFANKDRFRIV